MVDLDGSWNRLNSPRRTEMDRGKGLYTIAEPASQEQRDKCKGQACVGCGRCDIEEIDPAHIVARLLGEKVLWVPGMAGKLRKPREDRVVGGCDDADCVIPLCRDCHRKFDGGASGTINLLERMLRPEMALEKYEARRLRAITEGVETIDLLVKITRPEFKAVFHHAMVHLEHLTFDFLILDRILREGSRIFREDDQLKESLLEIRVKQKQGRL